MCVCSCTHSHFFVFRVLLIPRELGTVRERERERERETDRQTDRQEQHFLRWDRFVFFHPSTFFLASALTVWFSRGESPTFFCRHTAVVPPALWCTFLLPTVFRFRVVVTTIFFSFLVSERAASLAKTGLA